MKKSRRIGYLTKEGFRNVWVNRLMSFASIAVLMACLIMVGSAFMVLVNIQSVMTEIEGQNIVMVYLEDGTTAEEIQDAKQEIVLMSNVKDVVFVDKETAFREQLKELGSDATYFDGVENPLPDMFEVSLVDMTKFDSSVKSLSEVKHVNSIRDNKDLAQTLVKIRSTIAYISIAVIAVLLVISLFIVANTVRITMFSRRLEINIMKSVGATNWFIRWPFMVEGMVLGAISGILSLGIVWGAYRLVEPTVESFFKFFISDYTLVPFMNYVLYLLAAFVILGVISGGIGSLFSIQKYLKERGGVVYEEED